ncbi:endolytic transglycosylase MltG [Pseudohongiella sp. O18]|uniref:endolytic transglycosylase MltG n=1 Tax=Pseudohongiella sp. O18 TaxID=2904248 RepID=UPI001EFF8868|nr:endolytic transglycosylase MltG [Pseudohongiella sp. O18]
MLSLSRLIKYFCVMVALCISAALLGWLSLNRYLESPIGEGGSSAESIVIDIPAGFGVNQVASLLQREAGLKWPRIFAAWTRAQGQDRSIRSGEFAIEPSMTPPEILALLVSGRNVQYPVTLVEGWTIDQALSQLWAIDTISSTLQGLTHEEILAQLQSPYPALEGSLFPDTYFHTRGTTDIDILRRANQRLQQTMNELWPARDAALPYETPWEALIMASIIERESGYNAEKNAIAGVFVRRLQRGMRLQSDPTVIYGMGAEYQGNIRRRDLETTTPWNTYRINGLPPTPIALSGRASIEASLHPAEGTALYFVSRGDGSHQFSDTLEEHNAAVRQYILNRTSD